MNVPASKRPSSRRPHAATAESGVVALPRTGVLIVDPDRAARTPLAHLLSDRYAVYEAEDGLMALRLASMIPNLAVVVSEVKLPTIDGVDLAKLFKTHALLKDIPFVFLSAGASPNDVLRFLGTGANRYLCKSLTPEKVVKVVATLSAR